MFKKQSSDSKKSAKEIHDNFLSSYGIDLDQIYMEYYKLVDDDKAEAESKANHIKVEVLNNIPSSNDSASDLVKWNITFYPFFVDYENLLCQLKTKNQNDIQQDECNKIFGLDIQKDILDSILKDEANQVSTLEKIYGIYVSIDIHDIIIKQIETLETKFANRFHYDLRKSYMDCLKDYEAYKAKKSALFSDITGNLDNPELYSDKNLTYFELCWNIISSNNIGKVSTYNTIFKYCKPCVSGNRRDILDPLLYNFKDFNQEKISEIIIDQFHLDVFKKGTANHINEQLEYLTSAWNNNIKIAVLLDLYWDMQEMLDKIIQVKIIRLPRYEEADFNQKAHNRVSENRIYKSPLTGKSVIFTTAFFEDTYTIFDKWDIAEYINDVISSTNQKNLLYPFVPNIKYSKSNGAATVPEAFSEITLNISLDKEIREFYKNNYNELKQGNNNKYKTFEDLLSIYTEHFSYTKTQDFYFLENFTCLNLSMKLYNYLWPIASELFNDSTDIGAKKQSMLYDYLNEIISALFRIRSPYLRLRVADIVIQSYGASKYQNDTHYITALVAITKFLNLYVDGINDTYSMVYDATFYYYTKKINSDCDYSLLLKELDALINHYYCDYIRIDPDSIYSDIISKSNPMWKDLLNEKKGNRRIFYHIIIKSIMLNRS